MQAPIEFLLKGLSICSILAPFVSITVHIRFIFQSLVLSIIIICRFLVIGSVLVCVYSHKYVDESLLCGSPLFCLGVAIFI